MKPRLAVIKDFNGLALIRWVVDVRSNVVYVTDNEGAERVGMGLPPIRVIGFPRSDVFQYDLSGGVADGEKPNWSTMTPFLDG